MIYIYIETQLYLHLRQPPPQNYAGIFLKLRGSKRRKSESTLGKSIVQQRFSISSKSGQIFDGFGV